MSIEYKKDNYTYYKEKSEEDNNKELIYTIIKTKNELVIANKNYEQAEKDMIDYFLYQIKAYQSKLNYLFKQAKVRKIEVDNILQFDYKESKVI